MAADRGGAADALREATREAAHRHTKSGCGIGPIEGRYDFAAAAERTRKPERALNDDGQRKLCARCDTVPVRARADIGARGTAGRLGRGRTDGDARHA